jgi:hypothetical protein
LSPRRYPAAGRKRIAAARVVKSHPSVHLSGELFKAMTGTTMQHVPYRGTTAAMSFIADETEKWAKVVKFSGAKPD